MTGDMKVDTFVVFVDHFNLTHESLITIAGFAVMSRFLMLELVED